MIRDMLAVVDNADAAAPFVRKVLALAEVLGAHVEVAALTPSPYVAAALLPLGGMYVPDEDLARDEQAKVAAVQALVGGAGPASVFGLHADVAWLAGDLRRSRQIADLILVGAAEEWETPWLRQRVLENSILASGTPTVLLPQGSTLGAVRHAVLAWKPSPEANRALHDLVAVAETGARVDVVIVDQDGTRDAGEEVVRHLVRHGLAPELHRMQSDGLSDADAIHRFAARSGADLLVAGGFARSRMREILFGGVTRHLLEDAALPVMLSR